MEELNEELYPKMLSLLSTRPRVELLSFLAGSPATHTELSQSLNISPSEISRHLTRFSKYHLIKKDSETERKYELTPLGQVIVILSRPLIFIFRNSTYFKNHRLTDLPIDFLREIYKLECAEIITCAGMILTALEQICNYSSRECWIMTNHPLPLGNKTVRASVLIPTQLENYQVFESHFSSVCIRTLPKVTIFLAISDKNKGIILFPQIDQPDFNMGFYVTDQEGIIYLKSIWTYLWDQGENIY